MPLLRASQAELRDELEDAQYLFEGVELTEKEKADLRWVGHRWTGSYTQQLQSLCASAKPISCCWVGVLGPVVGGGTQLSAGIATFCGLRSGLACCVLHAALASLHGALHIDASSDAGPVAVIMTGPSTPQS